jgi:argininosuccinate synthase
VLIYKENIKEAIDAKEEFVEDYVFPLMKANGCYKYNSIVETSVNSK